MTLLKRDAAFAPPRRTERRGLSLTRDIIRLNHTLGELNHSDVAIVNSQTLPGSQSRQSVCRIECRSASTQAGRPTRLLLSSRSVGDGSALQKSNETCCSAVPRADVVNS